jgi:hypothetical protein
MVTAKKVAGIEVLMTDITNTRDDFNFEKWSELASKDPDAFEERRERLINEFIMDMPEEKRQRMRCLQWRVDNVRKLSKTPMAACIEISRMMWDSIKGENGLLEALQALSDVCQLDGSVNPDALLKAKSTADVLEFRAKADSKADFATSDLP